MSVVELPRADTPPQEPQGEHQAEAGPSTPQKDLPPPPDDLGSNSPPPSPSSLHTQQDQSRTASNEDVTNPPPSAQVPTTPLASHTDTSIPSSSTHPSTTLNNTVESKEVDEGSWSPSILTVPVKGRVRRKSGKAATNGKGTLSSTAEPPSTPTSSEGKQSTKRRKISFFKRISFICTSCVSSSPRTHDVDIEEGPSRESEQRDPEKQPSKETETAEHPTQEPSSSNNTMIPSTQALTVATATLDPSDDIAIVVPPTPTRQLLPLDETDGLTSGAVQPPGSTGEIKQDVRITVGESEDSDGSEDDAFVDGHQVEEWEDEEQRLIRQGGTGIPVGPDGTPQPLLPSLSPKYAGRKCLVLDLDETLVHSSLRPVPAPDYIVPVEIENNWHNFYVLKRPGVDNFLKKMGELYEVVVFTASLSKYADPVLDRLDPGMTVAHRLFRESCYNHRGNYVKDLSQLGRPISDTIILDNSPASYIFHPHNAVPVSSWFNDPHDTELTDLCPFLEDLSTASDVRGILNPFVQHS